MTFERKILCFLSIIDHEFINLVQVIKCISLAFTDAKLKSNSIKNQGILNFTLAISMKKWFPYKNNC